MNYCRKWIIRLSFISFLSIPSTCLHAASNQIENMAFTDAEDGSGAVLAIESAEKIKAEVESKDDPPQILIHLKDAVLCPKIALPKSNSPFIQEITVSCSGSGPDSNLKTITVLLKQKCLYTLAQKDWVLTLNIKGNRGLETMPMVSPAGIKKPSTDYRTSAIRVESYRDAEEFDTALRTLSAQTSLEEIVNVGIANHRPLQIARKELKLAQQKLFEARRNFFPSVAARASQSEGSTLISPTDSSTRADFRRKELGIELGQPIFQSGRLYYSQKQANAQQQAAELSILKTYQEAAFEILKNVYTFLQTKEAVVLRKALLEDSAKIVDSAKKKRDIGVASESEYLGVSSLGNQIEYKSVSEEKDFEIARSRLMDVLNVDSLPVDIPISLNELSSKKVPAVNLDLDNLLALSLSSRPEMKAAYLRKKVKEYARKAARGEYLVKVDASGFVGQSGAAFATENLKMKDSYNVGVRGTLYFGGSSVAPQISREKTAPDLGSNSRTETRAESVTVGLLDSLGARSNYFQAQIDEEKAKEEFSASRKQIVIEVKEAFFNYQRAKIQIETTKKELEYRKKEAAIAQAKDRNHQIEAPQYLSAVSGMTEAEVGIREAMAYYLTALAALEKAAGQPLTR